MKPRKPAQTLHWDYNKIMKFVGLLRARPIIWDHDHPQFRNKFRRDLAYDELSFEMNTTNDRIKKKIHTMRSQYLSEWRKSEKDKTYKSLWQYYDTFKFLYNHDKIPTRPQSANPNPVTPSNGDSDCEAESAECDLGTEITDTMDGYEMEEYENHVDDNYDTRTSSSVEFIEELNNEYCPPPQKQMRLYKYDAPVAAVEALCTARMETKAFSKIQDEFTTLAESLASEMRLLKEHPTIQNALRMKILKAVKDAQQALRIKKLNE